MQHSEYDCDDSSSEAEGGDLGQLSEGAHDDGSGVESANRLLVRVNINTKIRRAWAAA